MIQVKHWKKPQNVFCRHWKQDFSCIYCENWRKRFSSHILWKLRELDLLVCFNLFLKILWQDGCDLMRWSVNITTVEICSKSAWEKSFRACFGNINICLEGQVLSCELRLGLAQLGLGANKLSSLERRRRSYISSEHCPGTWYLFTLFGSDQRSCSARTRSKQAS